MVGRQETGNETYIKGLVEGLKTTSDGAEVIVFNVGRPWTSPSPRIRFRRLLTGNPLVRLGVELPIRSIIDRLDLLHVTYSAPAYCAAPIVLTVHDICFTTNPEWFSARDLRVLSAMVPRSIRNASHVVTVSEDARRRIMETYDVAESRISAIPNGPGGAAEAISLDAAKRELAAAHLEPPRPYLLTVGNLQPRKNLVRLIQAFQLLVENRHHDIDLVVVGPKRYRGQEAIDTAPAVRGRVHFTGYLSDRLLAAAYTCATLFVLPSLYEGFGLPAIEAMAHGIPVAASHAGSLPEVCGDAALFFDPYSAEAIADALDRLLVDSELRLKLSRVAIIRAQAFDWRKTAEQTMEVYRKVAAQSSR
jgi:glycosyltransferase involved in cell wall biosynthesis